ncbi:MAG: sugar phosphate isomerase/epimerase [Tannerella sp.]|jgi:sugar phosphate isomerase/epimerase|nr:sugar phosphate isomerase/epimerase [Tannerella sp.]
MKKNMLKMKCAVMLLAMTAVGVQAADKPDSRFAGVQIGTITYSFRSMKDQSLTAILEYAVQTGLSSVELMGGAVEQYAGIPSGQDAEAVRRWRTSVSMDKFREIRKLFKERGVKIDILKLGDPDWSDAEIDYAFRVCKTLGAKGITTEISEKSARRLAPFADKHKRYVIFHNHGQPGRPDFSFDRVLAVGPRVMLNFDAGHYFGATGKDPCELIQRLHARIVSIHLKDKTGPEATPRDTNRPFGEGQTPVGEILRLIRKEKWPITCDIELEYEIPQDSDAVKEVIKCVDYCRKALLPDAR